MNEDNDASSNPSSDEHLPVSGEFDAPSVSDGDPVAEDLNDLENQQADDESLDEGAEIEDPNDINEISAKKTDQLEEAPNPDGPADPDATNGSQSGDDVA